MKKEVGTRVNKIAQNGGRGNKVWLTMEVIHLETQRKESM